MVAKPTMSTSSRDPSPNALLDARLRDLLASMPDAIVLANPAGRIVFSNSRADDLFGYAPGGLRGKPVESLTRFAATGPELSGLRRDGTQFPVEISRSPLHTDDGTLVMSVIRDITEQMRIERALNERNLELEAANTELEAFDYSIAHDLRAPLNRIEGFAALLEGQYGDRLDVHGRELLQRVVDANRNMHQLVGDLLALSTVTRGTLARRAVDVSALAREIGATLRRSEPQRQVHFEVAAGMAARADPGLLRVVLENLLANAWKFTRGRAQASVEVGWIESQGGRIYFVRDNGAGFDLAHAEKLFKPFKRLHSGGEFEGTGIGLATVQRIVRRHGGRVWAEASVDRGATIFFTLSRESGPL